MKFIQVIIKAPNIEVVGKSYYQAGNTLDTILFANANRQFIHTHLI